MKLQYDYNKGYARFLNEKRKREFAKNTHEDFEDKELKDFMKNVLPLMTFKDLVGALVMKGVCDSEGVKIMGIPYGNDEYEVEIKRVNSKKIEGIKKE